MAASSSIDRLVLPPNLKIDPKSSFAANPVELLNQDDEEEDDDDDDIDDDTSLSSKVDDDDIDDSELNEEDDDDDDFEYPMRLVIPQVQYAVPLPERLNVTVHTLFASPHSNDNETGTLYLNESVFGHDPIRIDLLKRAVDYYRAKKRGRRKAVTKTISEVSGSGRKRRQQKGTGQARMGHSRPAHHRGGAKAHGPKNVTDYGNTKLNKKVRKQALCHALSQKLLEGNLVVVNSLFELPTHKTKELARILAPWGIGGRSGTTALILDSYYVNKTTNEDNETDAHQQQQPASFKGVPVNVVVAAANLRNVKVGNDHEGSVYDILKHEKLVMTLAALQQLEQRLQDL
jgi:large subunit ribosomal protein L4